MISDLFKQHGYVVIQTGCWIWTGPYQYDYYGKCGARYAHRVSYEIHNGPIPKGMNVCHRCDVPMCVNPKHLFLGDQKRNVNDSMQKGRYKHGRRPRRSLEHWGLTKKDAEDITFKVKKQMRKKTVVAREYGISVYVLDNILKGGVSSVE